MTSTRTFYKDPDSCHENECFEEHRDEQENLHRLDGPAKIYKGVGWSWWRNGVCHRSDGPADYNPKSSTAIYKYCIDGEWISLSDFKRWYLMTHLKEYDQREKENPYST